MRRAGSCALVLAALVGAGCETAPRGIPKQDGYRPPKTVRYEKREPAALTYAEVAAKYNVRVMPLDHLTAPVTLVIDSPEEGGGHRHDQVEANLQFTRPRKVALRLDKVGETLAYLGSNDEKYWWFELRGEKVGLVGTHAKATPRSAAKFGIPVHPLDLIDLLAVMPLPAGGEGASVRKADDGKELMVTLPSRGRGWGERRVYMDAATYRPSRVELRDARGAVVAFAEIGKYVEVAVRGDPNTPAMIASRYDVTIPGEETTVAVTLADPENPKERMRSQPFDLALLLKSYGLERVIDADAEPAK